MEGKYGRLFTIEDVQQILNWGRLEGSPESAMGIVADIDERESLRPLTFPADEPLFLLRGQDKAASLAIASTQPHATGVDYAQASLNVGASQDHLSAAWKAAAEMRDWQEANPERVKVPD